MDINDHIPSLTDEDEMIIKDRLSEMGFDMYDDSYDVADLAMRTCACGVKLDGFYEYVDHLKDVL